MRTAQERELERAKERELEDAIRPIVWGIPSNQLEKLAEVWQTIIGEKGAAGRRALARVDRFYLLTNLLKRVDAIHPWLYERCREVEKDPDGYLDLWAREHYKSTIITWAGCIQEILNDPNITIGIFSHTRPIAAKFLTQIKEELERNQDLKDLFPDILWQDPKKEAPRWSQEKGIVVKRDQNPKESTVEASGLVDGMPTGAHYALLVYDDVVTLESVGTPEQVEKTTNAWALSDNLGARNEQGMLRKWGIGTRYHFGDTYKFILDQKLLKARIFAATDDGSFTGEPVFLSKAAWEEKKKLPAAVVACQQLQNPAAGSQVMFQKEWLRFTDIRPLTLNVAILCDPASSKKKGSDKTALMAVGIDTARNRYLLDGYHHKMGLAERWQKIRDLQRYWSAQPGVQIVKVGYERFGMTDALEYFEERMQIEGVRFEIIELAWPREGPGSKIDRIQRMEPHFKAGRFYLIAKNVDEQGNVVETANQRRVREDGQEYRILKPVRRVDHEGKIYALNKGVLDEYLVYPYAPHDDALDCMSRFDDIDMPPPVWVDERALEPEAFADGA